MNEDSTQNLVDANIALTERVVVTETALKEALKLLFMLEDKSRTTEECYREWIAFKARYEELIIESMVDKIYDEIGKKR